MSNEENNNAIPVRLSQVMIVKNEERNIEKALGWAKDIAFEQIVVDTGSDDRTVEIAEKLGAKVLHFKWIDDFGAAKNFAIEQASGNWIAFLDADEYFTPTDAKELMVLLEKICGEPEVYEKALVLNMPWVQLGDDGKPIAITEQYRVFRNLPTIRYSGRIHELLTAASENVFRAELNIMHTGYAQSSLKGADKAHRNITMLRREMTYKPDDLDLKGYLADALCMRDDTDSHAEAELLYRAVADGVGACEYHKKNALRHLINKSLNESELYDDGEELCLKAIKEFPDDIDFLYYYGTILNLKGEHNLAWGQLQICEQRLLEAKQADVAFLVAAQPLILFSQLARAAQAMGDVQNLVKYCTMILLADKTQAGVLGSYIVTLTQKGISDDEILTLLSKVYDFKSIKDMLFIAKTAKECGALPFAKKIVDIAGAAM